MNYEQRPLEICQVLKLFHYYFQNINFDIPDKRKTAPQRAAATDGRGDCVSPARRAALAQGVALPASGLEGAARVRPAARQWSDPAPGAPRLPRLRDNQTQPMAAPDPGCGQHQGEPFCPGSRPKASSPGASGGPCRSGAQSWGAGFSAPAPIRGGAWRPPDRPWPALPGPHRARRSTPDRTGTAARRAAPTPACRPVARNRAQTSATPEHPRTGRAGGHRSDSSGIAPEIWPGPFNQPLGLWP